MKKPPNLILKGFFLLLLFVLSNQTTAFSQCTITGDSLGNYPGVTFPTLTPTTTGTSLVFGSGNTDQVIMRLPLIPPGALASNSNVSYKIRFHMKRITSDNDPLMIFTDGVGTSSVGFVANDGNSHYKIDGTITGTAITSTYTSVNSCNGSCGTNVNDPYIVDMTFNITSGAVTTIDTTIQGNNVQGSLITYTQTFDPSTGINFILGKQTGSENYQIDSVTFVCSTPPSVNSITADTSVCEGDSIAFMVQAAGATSFQWQLNGNDVTGATASTYSIPSSDTADAGNYTCIVSNTVGSDTSSTLVFGVNPNPTAQITGPGMVCDGTSLTLNGMGTGGTPGYTYLWNPGAMTMASITLTPTGDTTVTFMVTDSVGCSSGEDTLSVTWYPSPSVMAMGDTTVCAGDSAALSAMGSGGTLPYTYTWNPGTVTGQNIMVAPSATTDYGVTLSDSNGCQANDSASVTIAPLPVAGFTATTSQDTASFTSTSTGATTWAWDFGDGNASTQENPVNIYAGAGSYQACLTVTNSLGCENTACDSVEIILVGLEDQVFKGSLKVFPNPSNGQFTLECSYMQTTPISIEVMGMDGSVLFSETENGTQDYRREINLSHLTQGVYFLKIKAENEEVVRKLIIQK